MAIIKKKEMRKLKEEELNKKLQELKLELAKERANVNIGASASSPGRLREIRKTIARIMTLKNSKGDKRKNG